MEGAARLQGFFNISLKFLIKIPLNKQIYPFSQKTLGEERPSMSPKSGDPYGNRRQFPEPSLAYL